MTALHATSAWQRFAASRADLTRSDWLELSSASQRLRESVAPGHVDAYEPTLATRRDQYRRQRMDEVMNSLRGRSASYVEAFTDAADAVDFAVDGLMPQLVACREPRDVGTASDLDFVDSDRVTFTPSVPIFGTGQLVYISDPLVEEIGQVTMVHLGMEHGVSRQRIGVRLAPGFARAWGL